MVGAGGDAWAVASGPGIAGDAGLEVACLAHIEDARFSIQHTVNAGAGAQRAEVGLDPGVAGLILPLRHTNGPLILCLALHRLAPGIKENLLHHFCG